MPSRYTLLNAGLIGAAAIVLAWTKPSRAQIHTVLRTAFVVTLLAYPWDFFAVHWGAWTYGDQVDSLFGVNPQDLVFIFGCTTISAALLRRREDPYGIRGSDSKPNGEGGSYQERNEDVGGVTRR